MENTCIICLENFAKENDIKLMKGVILSFFIEDLEGEQDNNSNSLAFPTLNSLKPKTQLDYAYYNAKIKSIYFQDKDNIISEVEIDFFSKGLSYDITKSYFVSYFLFSLSIVINCNIIIWPIFTFLFFKAKDFRSLSS